MNNQIELLHSGEVDVAFIRLPVGDEELAVTPLFPEPLHAATSSHGELAGLPSVTVEDLLDPPFAVAGGGTPPAWSSYWSLDAQRGERSRVGAVAALRDCAVALVHQCIGLMPGAEALV